MPGFNFRNMCLGLAAMAALAFSAPMLQAQIWVGSTGTIDPNSVNLVKYINGRVELRNDAPVGSVAFIRYNVLPVRDLSQDLQDIELQNICGALSRRWRRTRFSLAQPVEPEHRSSHYPDDV